MSAVVERKAIVCFGEALIDFLALPRCRASRVISSSTPAARRRT